MSKGVFAWLGDRVENVENIGGGAVNRVKLLPSWFTGSGGEESKPNPGPFTNVFGVKRVGNGNMPYTKNWDGRQLEQGEPERINPDDFANGGDSGASAAAYVQSLINGINESFERQRGALDSNKANSAAGIQRNFDSFKQGLANNQALYQQGSAAIQAEITRRMAESAARNAETSRQVAAAVGGIGGSASAASAQAAANQASLAASQGYQQDLTNRLDQIMAANQRSAENSGELVRQGASGNLENNYNAILNALMAQREQGLLQAQQARSGGGGGGGGGTDYSKAYKQFNDRQKLDWALNDETPDPMQIVNMMLRNGGSDAAAGLAYLTSLGPKNSENN
jgi:hypothetical protein